MTLLSWAMWLGSWPPDTQRHDFQAGHCKGLEVTSQEPEAKDFHWASLVLYCTSTGLGTPFFSQISPQPLSSPMSVDPSLLICSPLSSPNTNCSHHHPCPCQVTLPLGSLLWHPWIVTSPCLYLVVVTRNLGDISHFFLHCHNVLHRRYSLNRCWMSM